MVRAASWPGTSSLADHSCPPSAEGNQSQLLLSLLCVSIYVSRPALVL